MGPVPGRIVLSRATRCYKRLLHTRVRLYLKMMSSITLKVCRLRFTKTQTSTCMEKATGSSLPTRSLAPRKPWRHSRRTCPASPKSLQKVILLKAASASKFSYGTKQELEEDLRKNGGGLK